MNRPARLLIPLIVCLALAGCSRERSAAPAVQASATSTAIDESKPQDGGTLIRRLESDVSTLNPILAAGEYDKIVGDYLFTPLLYLDANLRPIAGLADSWEISKDGLEYTFHLNPKATFSDGQPVKASDVLFTLRKIMEADSESVQVAAAFITADVKRSRAIDDHTVVIGFKEALAAQLVRFAELATLPEHVYKDGDFKTAYTSTAVGSGPYKLVRRVPGKEILLERRADFWGRKPYIQTVLFKVITDGQTAWNALKVGDIDETVISSDIFLRDGKRPELRRYIDFRRFYMMNYNYIGWNGRNPLFADKRVRRALGMCVNLESVVNDLYHGTARAMSGPFTPDEYAFNPEVPVLPYDPQGALRILNSLGWLDTNHDGILDRGGKPFRFEMSVFAGNQIALPFAQLLQAELKKIGVEMSIAPIEPASLIDRVLHGNYDAVFMAWNLDADPDNSAEFHSREIIPNGQNFVYYSNPEADRLLDAARRELDFSKRTKLYQQLHAVLADDQPYTWTVQVSSKWAFNKRVHGVKESKGYGLERWYPGPLDWWIPVSERRR
ncbi:MAG TPA: ABC transporter substrate-binding protein [Thermoanaerobaculia bacterium]|nr:ABC transporter substrate-binding protein [Thermoanaerobaculia bacterium]